MKFRALALDYDGTIARDGVLDRDVRSAIADARAEGIRVVLVTGRIVSELESVAGPLDFLDAVVGENGAVLRFPNGYSRLMGRLPPESFLWELRRRRVSYETGQCVVESEARFATAILEAIRELELPLSLSFNRGRVMVLPPAVSKATGLRQALTILHLSVHNAIAIGDAENDHDLLSACELGVAVEWGSAALKDAADFVLSGDGPAAVAPYIRHAIHADQFPRDRIGRNRVALGKFDNGQPLSLAIKGRNMVVAGDPRSGKSWVAGLACEQWILQGYSLCVIDPEGDYRPLEWLPGVVVFGGDDPAPELPDLARVLRHPDLSAVVDLSHVPHREKIRYMDALLPMLASMRRGSGLPHRVVIDEAHYFLSEPNVLELLDLDLGGYTLVTYRMSDLHPLLREAIHAVIVKRTTDLKEVRTLLAMASMGEREAEWAPVFGSLPPDQAILLPGIEEAEGEMRRFRLLPRLTSHVRHKSKYLDVKLVKELAFVFTQNGSVFGGPARSLKELITQLPKLPFAVLDGHARRGDFSRWIAGVFHDHHLASDVRKAEQRHRLGLKENLSDSIAQLIQQRYEFFEGEAAPHD